MAHARRDRPELPTDDAQPPTQVWPIWRDGVVVDWHVVRNEAIDPASLSPRTREALAMAGAWSDLDWDQMLDYLDRIRQESKPTPPIEDL